MANFAATTTCNEPLLCDPKSASAVLDRYHFDGDVRAFISWQDADEQTHLILSGNDWPTAWILPYGEDPAEFEPGYDADPSGEMENFLRDIAPFLAEPLTVQAIGCEGCRFPLCACEWHIEPGSTEVEVNEFTHRETVACCA